MASRIEDYALIGDCHTAALVGRDGSLDWLCLPRFDSPACFAALLGGPEHGRWSLAPAGAVRSIRRSYRAGTLIVETVFEAETGTVALIDFMPSRDDGPAVIRIVEGRRGVVPMHMELTIRCDYGSIVPWVMKIDGGLRAIAGPDTLVVRSEIPMHGENLRTLADFTVSEGQKVPFVLNWHPSHLPTPAPVDPHQALSETETWWGDWSGRCTEAGPWHEAVSRSLITLKAMTYAPTGGIVAAATTSLPEWIGSVRNWDYRYCWIRDASLTFAALLKAGYTDEALAWREWLLRAVAGIPSDLQIMYSIDGGRRLTELTLPWLPGYENSAPVRIGNAAHAQFQLDIYGELSDTLQRCREVGLADSESGWNVNRAFIGFVESHWDQPDEGIWEVRGPRRHFTHSKMMAWVAIDRAIRAVEQFGLEGPLDRWRALRDTIHAQVCHEGLDADRNAFVQYYGSKDLDASLLMMPLVGFLPATDPRVLGTVSAIERELLVDGFVARYPTVKEVDGLPPGEGVFLACSFWLVDNLALQGRQDDARHLFERLLDLRNDVGLLSEEYDPSARRLLGNFPQAFSHISLVNSAFNLMSNASQSEHAR